MSASGRRLRQNAPALTRLRPFLSPQIAQLVVGAGEDLLRTHRREIAALFCDLRGFTAFSACERLQLKGFQKPVAAYRVSGLKNA